MEFSPNSVDAYKLLHAGTLAFYNAEKQGMRIDLKYVHAKKQELSERITQLESVFYQTNFFKRWKHISKRVNINSNAQLSNYLYNHLKIKPKKFTETGKGATDEGALEALNIPELNQILEIRKLKKIRDTYLASFEREQINGYIHPFYNLHTVKTFRSSSDRPNFQNIPKRNEEGAEICRKAIYPRPGHQLLTIDFKALEVAISACYNKDPVMLQYINNPMTDMHRDMTVKIFKLDKYTEHHDILRSATKNGFVFPQFYGDYYGNNAFSLACEWGNLPETKWKKGQGIMIGNTHISDLLIDKGIKSLSQFTNHLKHIETYFWNERFKHYRDWKERWWQTYQKKGYFDLYTGFRCQGVMGRNNCTNYPIQGSAFHCLLWSFIKLDEIFTRRKFDTKLIGQIHDEIIMDVHPNELDYVISIAKKVTGTMLKKHWDWIITPLKVEAELAGVDKSWAELEKIKI